MTVAIVHEYPDESSPGDRPDTVSGTGIRVSSPGNFQARASVSPYRLRR